MVESLQAILKVKNLNFSYPENKNNVLKNISFEILSKQKVVLLGPNGAGKTTLMNNILKINEPQNGKIFFKDNLLNHFEEDELRQSISYVFQNPDDQIFASTVQEDILFGPEQFSFPEHLKKNRFNQVVELLALKSILKRNPRNLSYGEKKKVALAGVLILEPDLILFDEPLAFLDPPTQQLFIDVLNQISANGKSIMIATHNLNFAAEWGEKFLLLNKNGELKVKENKNFFRTGVKNLGNSLTNSSKIFKGFAAENALPVTTKESRNFLKNLLDQKMI